MGLVFSLLLESWEELGNRTSCSRGFGVSSHDDTRTPLNHESMLASCNGPLPGSRIGLGSSEPDSELGDEDCGSRQCSNAGFVTASGVHMIFRGGVSTPLLMGKVPSISS